MELRLCLCGPLLCIHRARSDQRCGASQCHHEAVQAPGKTVDVEIERIVVAVGDLRVNRGMERGNKPTLGAYAGDNINQCEAIVLAVVKAGSGVRASLRCLGALPRG